MSTDDPEPVTWHAVGMATAWPEEGGRVVQAGRRRIAVFHHQGGWYALDERCPHERVGLAGGRLDAGRVVCPGHGWAFRLTDGWATVGPPDCRVVTHPLRIADGEVQVGIRNGPGS